MRIDQISGYGSLCLPLHNWQSPLMGLPRPPTRILGMEPVSSRGGKFCTRGDSPRSGSCLCNFLQCLTGTASHLLFVCMSGKERRNGLGFQPWLTWSNIWMPGMFARSTPKGCISSSKCGFSAKQKSEATIPGLVPRCSRNIQRPEMCIRDTEMLPTTLEKKELLVVSTSTCHGRKAM